VVKSGDFAYLADGRAGLRVIDVSDATRPQEVGKVETPGIAWDVAFSGGLSYVAESDTVSYTTSRLRVIDVSNPQQPRQVGVIGIPGWAFGVTVIEPLAYVADLINGLRIIDVRDPTRLDELAVFYMMPMNTNAAAFAVEVVGGTAYVATAPMRAIDVSDPRHLREIGSVTSPLVPEKLATVADHIYAAAGFAGLLAYHIQRK
jgi:hypothetical protein